MSWGTDISGNHLRWYPETRPSHIPSDRRDTPPGFEFVPEGEIISTDHYMRFQDGSLVQLQADTPQIGEVLDLLKHWPLWKKIIEPTHR